MISKITLGINNFLNNNYNLAKAKTNKTNLRIDIDNTGNNISFICANEKIFKSIKKTT